VIVLLQEAEAVHQLWIPIFQAMGPIVLDQLEMIGRPGMTDHLEMTAQETIDVGEMTDPLGMIGMDF
jgi:hypothetical protein